MVNAVSEEVDEEVNEEEEDETDLVDLAEEIYR